MIFERLTVGDVFVSGKLTNKPLLPTGDVTVATVHGELTLTNFSLTPSSLILD